MFEYADLHIRHEIFYTNYLRSRQRSTVCERDALYLRDRGEVIVEIVGCVNRHVVTGFRRGEDRRASQRGNISCVIGMVKMSVAQENSFGLQIDEILNHKRSAAGNHFNPRD